MNWVAANSDTLQVFINALLALIWLTYLQVFLVTFLRHRRADLLISTGAGRGLEARCFITNLGLEPIYLSDVIVEIRGPSGTFRTTITDRREMSDAQLSDPADATNQRPLPSAARVDLGSFAELAQRVRMQGFELEEEIDSIEVVAVADSAVGSSLICATRTYKLETRNGRSLLLPTTRKARQVTSRRALKRLEKELEQNLAG